MSFPPQTRYIVGNEACERFSFYGMNSILTLYMTNVLLMSEGDAVSAVHLFKALIYVLPLLGAWVADRFVGRYRTILYVSLFYCLGHGVLACSDLVDSIEARTQILFTGLLIIALGAGGIKPCVSAFVGDQVEGGNYPKEMMTRVYAAFYWSINLGSFGSFLIIPFIRQTWGYSWAFAVPGIFMGIATLFFWCGRKSYLHKQPAFPEFLPTLFSRVFRGKAAAVARYGASSVDKAENTALSIAAFVVLAPIVVVLGMQTMQGAEQLAALSGATPGVGALWGGVALVLYLLALLFAGLKVASVFGSNNFFGITGSMLFVPRSVLESRYSADRLRENRNLLRVLAVFLMIIPFWSLFDQTMTSWVLQGEMMRPVSFSCCGVPFSFGAEEMQSFNPLLIIIFVPLVTLLVYPYIGRWSRPLKRMGVGIVLAGISYGVVALLQQCLDAGASLSILWQCIPYFLLTVSEILVSTTGLEYAYTAAGKNLKSTVAGFWFLTSTLGNFLVIFLTHLVGDPTSPSTFLMYGFLCAIVGAIFMFVTSRRALQAEE